VALLSLSEPPSEYLVIGRLVLLLEFLHRRIECTPLGF
jgi:hypothetical protein